MSRPAAGGTRAAVERRSAPILVALVRLPRLVLAAVAAAVLVTGLTVGGVVGGLALGLIALTLLWLAYLSWPGLAPAARTVRVAMVALVAGSAVLTALGRF